MAYQEDFSSNILRSVVSRFANKSNRQQLAGILAIQYVRRHVGQSDLTGSLRHGILRVHTHDHAITMQLHRDQLAIKAWLREYGKNYGLDMHVTKILCR
jgi:nicotinic acid phosphoribosyltransferase